MMLNLLISLSAILIYLIAAYGWGRLAVDRFYDDNRPGWTFTTVLGLGIWIFIGGLLNAARLAYPIVLDTMLGLGVGFAIAFAYPSVNKHRITAYFHDGRARFRKTFFSHWLPFAIIGMIFLFLVLTLMPASAFSFDDYYTYMPRPVRMLQTGSLGGNPFDVLGADSLGAQAFLQSFFVNRFPLSYINAFDAISCFVLGLLLLWEMGRRLGIHWAFSLASLLTFIVIHPQYINISSLYSGSLMILATVFASIVFADDMGGTDTKRAFAGAVAVALFLTSLVALKTTFAIFAVTYFVVYFGCALYLSKNRPRIVRSMFFTILAAMILIIPWILLSLPNYLTALHLALEGNAAAVAGGGDGGMDFISKIVTVFSLEKGWWSSNFFTYSLLASLLAAVGVTSLFLLIKSRDILHRRRLDAISAACVAAAISYFTNAYLLDPMNATRYSIPILIAVTSVTSLLLVQSGLSSLSLQNLKRSAIASAGGMAVLSVAVVIGGVFLNGLVNRSQRAYYLRTLLSFPFDGEYLAYNYASLGKSAAGNVLDMQHKIEGGRAILAILATPFHLDYARNPIFNVNESTFLTPWSDFPLNADPEVARKYLSDRGIQYVIFEYRGFSVKPDGMFKDYIKSPYWMLREVGESNVGFRKVLRYLAENSRLIYTDSQVVIFDISQKTLLPSPITGVGL